jgi:hypothetical protein
MPTSRTQITVNVSDVFNDRVTFQHSEYVIIIDGNNEVCFSIYPVLTFAITDALQIPTGSVMAVEPANITVAFLNPLHGQIRYQYKHTSSK